MRPGIEIYSLVAVVGMAGCRMGTCTVALCACRLVPITWKKMWAAYRMQVGLCRGAGDVHAHKLWCAFAKETHGATNF